MNLKKLNKMFCSHVINHISIPNESGIIKPCCRYQTDEANLPTIFVVDTLDEALHSLYRKNLDKMLQDGIRPKGCQSCWDLEDINMKSRRQWGNQLPYEKKNQVQDLEFALDFTCNMMCRICRPRCSSKWNSAKDTVDNLNAEGFDMPFISNHKNYIDRLKYVLENSNLSGLRKITLVGGEPFYSKSIEWLFDLLEQKCDISKISLYVITNGSIFPSQGIIDKIKEFQQCAFFISIDAIGKLAETIRWGVGWNIIESNINRYLELRSTSNNIKVEVQTVLSLLNLNHMQVMSNYFGERDVIIGINPIEQPDYLSVHRIPIKIRKKWLIEEKYEHDPMINRAILKETGTNYQSGFQKAMDILDRHTGLRFAEVNPEMSKIMEKYGEP